jgi:transcriptional regulator GlxA family with amidase domain
MASETAAPLRMMPHMLDASKLAVFVLLVFLGSQGIPPAPRQQEPASAVFVCPPCGAECHFTTYPKPGSCGVCGMGLVPLASVPQVGVLLHPDVALASSMTTLALFAGSDAARAFSVADTVEPLRIGDALEVRPQFSLAGAPALDVLVVPDGYGAWEDPLILEWVKGAAGKARCVLAVGGGCVVLARAGFLAGERVPARRFLVQRGKELAPGLVFDAELDYRRAGKFFLARDAGAAIEATLAIVAELAGEERARRTAEDFGYPWMPEPK